MPVAVAEDVIDLQLMNNNDFHNTYAAKVLTSIEDAVRDVMRLIAAHVQSIARTASEGGLVLLYMGADPDLTNLQLSSHPPFHCFCDIL